KSRRVVPAPRYKRTGPEPDPLKKRKWGREIESRMSVIPAQGEAKARLQGGRNQIRRLHGGVEWRQRIRCPVCRARWEWQRKSRDGISAQRCCLSCWEYLQLLSPV